MKMLWMNVALLSWALGAVTIAGCDSEPTCPAGSILVDGRCVAESMDGGDTGVADSAMGDDTSVADSGGDGAPGDTGAGDTGAGDTGAGDTSMPDTRPPCGGCSGATPICDPSTDTCVGCLDHTDCAAPTALCDPDTDTCVACLEDADCPSALAPRCNANMCTPCTTSAQCARFAASPECNPATSMCVQCTPATEASRCGANSCDPTTSECTSTARGSLGWCDECVSDSECGANHLCVENRRGTVTDGTYCMRLSSAGCQAPATRVHSRTSTLGVTASFCFLYETQAVTCEAVAAFEADIRCTGFCVGDGVICPCPLPPATCNIGYECTHRCATANDCAGGAACIGAFGGNVCDWD